MKNKKYRLMTLSFILIAVIMFGCQALTGSDEAAPDGEPTVDIPPVRETRNVVSAEAFVVPIQDVNLAFEGNGRVVEISVAEGMAVEEGAILARLNNADAVAAIASAEAALAQAEANLISVMAGPTAEQIAVAEAAVTRAETNLAQVVAGPTAADIASAQARVDTLRAQLNQILAGTRPEQIRASETTVKQAEVGLSLAQREYDKIAYAADSDIGRSIALALQRETLNYEAALANHQALLNGATQAEVAVVRAQLGEGQAALNQLLAGATPEQIAIAQAGVLEAEAALAQARTGARPEQIAVAEAGVRQAEAALAQARLALDYLEIKAPFGGIITNLTIEVGEIVSAGVPIMNLANLSTWQIETDDLTEIDVVKVAENQNVSIRFDALNDEVFEGRVTRIKPRSETKAGDVTYTVVIDLAAGNDPRLRWGMTAFIEISAE